MSLDVQPSTDLIRLFQEKNTTHVVHEMHPFPKTLQAEKVRVSIRETGYLDKDD